MSYMAAKEILTQLKALGDEKRLAINAKQGAGKNQFGVPMGDIRTLAKKAKVNHRLGLELWKTGNIDAQLLATLILKPKELSVKELDRMVRDATFMQLAEWFTSYIIKEHPEKEALREKWMNDSDPAAARAGWALTAERVNKAIKTPLPLDLSALLDRIESDMSDAHPLPQWTMNSTLAAIGISSPSHRKRALAIGEKLGVYRDYPCSKGCTSPFAPIWINEMVKLQK